jgi:DNA polymerase III epsilon subunit family exonuclease
MNSIGTIADMNENILEKRISEIPLVALDLETTGFSPRTGDEIIEIGALKVLGDEAVSEFHTLVNPLRPIHPGASAVNGITNDMVAEEPLIQDVLPVFFEFIGDSPLIIHNAAFDLPFLAWKAAEMGLAERRNIVFDTLLLSRALRPEFANHKLGHVVARLGLGAPPPHRAVGDAWAAWKVFTALCAPLGNGDSLTVTRVLKVQRGPFPWPRGTFRPAATRFPAR